MAPIQSFPVFDFPDELVIRIVNVAFDPWDLHIEHDEYFGTFTYWGVPSYNLLLACKMIKPIAERERRRAFTGTLALCSNPELHREAFSIEWKGPPKAFSWLFSAVENLRVNGLAWGLAQTFINIKHLDIDVPGAYAHKWTNNENLEDIMKQDEANIEALKTQDGRDRLRSEWGLTNKDKCVMVSSMRLIYGGTSRTAWYGEVLVKFSMTKYTTKILDVTYDNTISMRHTVLFFQA